MAKVRKGQESPNLDRAEFERRMRVRFADPAFQAADTGVSAG
jgi:hypothetical protein